MQQYFMKNRISERADEWGLHLLMLLGALSVFIFLWDIRLPSLTAGIALYLFFVILRKKGQLQRTLRKEKSLRQKIGGELMLEKMLLDDPQCVHREIARLLISPRHHAAPTEVDGAVLLSLSSGETVLLRYLPLHPMDTLEGKDVAAAQRLCLKHKSTLVWLCAPGKISRQAIEQSSLVPHVRILDRDMLIALLGKNHPATDKDLIALHRRMHRKHKKREWLKELFRAEHAPKFARFAALMSALLFLTNQKLYGFSALWMMVLSSACRCAYAFTKKAPPSGDA